MDNTVRIMCWTHTGDINLPTNQDSEDLISDISPNFTKDIMNTHVLQPYIQQQLQDTITHYTP